MPAFAMVACATCGRHTTPTGRGYVLARKCRRCWHGQPPRAGPPKGPRQSVVRHCAVCDRRMAEGEGVKCSRCVAEYGLDRPKSWDHVPLGEGRAP